MVFLTSLFSLLCNSRFWEIMAFLWALIALVVTWVRPRLHFRSPAAAIS